MASVTFAGLYIDLAGQDAVPGVWCSSSALVFAPTMTLSAVTYADGASRISSMDDYLRKATCTLFDVPLATRRLLELPASRGGWLGRTVCFRDVSEKLFGFWDPPKFSPFTYTAAGGPVCDVDLSITETTYSDVQ